MSETAPADTVVGGDVDGMKAAPMLRVNGTHYGPRWHQRWQPSGRTLSVVTDAAERRSAQPEKRLMLAVLDEAVHTFRTHMGARRAGKKKVLAQVESWFAAEDKSWPFSFLSICESLDLNASRIRQALWNYQEAREAERLVTASEPRRPDPMRSMIREPGLFRLAF